MATGTSINGTPVNVGDQVTVLGAVASISGSAPSTASVTVTEQFGFYSPVVQANDCTAAQDTAGAAMSKNGKLFTTGDRVGFNGVVTAITPQVAGGNKQAAALTVKCDNSGLVVTVSAGSVRSNGA